MKWLILIFSLFFIVNVYAEKTITITLTDEEYKAMSVLTSTPEGWANNAVKNKAGKMIDELSEKYSDKKISKMSKSEKEAVVNSIDIEKEKESRTVKVK